MLISANQVTFDIVKLKEVSNEYNYNHLCTDFPDHIVFIHVIMEYTVLDGISIKKIYCFILNLIT